MHAIYFLIIPAEKTHYKHFCYHHKLINHEKIVICRIFVNVRIKKLSIFVISTEYALLDGAGE